MNKNIKVIYNKLANLEINNQGYINLNNLKIQSQEDIMNLCNIFRDPRYETFRIFYMKNNKIIGQEAFTNKIPDGVNVFKGNGESIRGYEKMKNRMQRLNADGYYLAHNHPSGSAKASPNDLMLTQKFAKNVKGFLGHIIIGLDNRYSIIEKNNEGKVLALEEQVLDNSAINKIDENFIENSFYNMKIAKREDLVALLMKMQSNIEYSTVILADAKNNIRMVLDIPNKMFNQNIENLNGFFKNIGRNIGANKVFVGTHNQKTYFKIIEHQRYGTFKDMVFIDNDRIIIPKITQSPNLFDKEKRQKNRKNREIR